MNPNLRQGDELMRLRQFADAAELYQLIPHADGDAEMQFRIALALYHDADFAAAQRFVDRGIFCSDPSLLFSLLVLKYFILQEQPNYKDPNFKREVQQFSAFVNESPEFNVEYPICQHFRKGTCGFGPKCSNQHPAILKKSLYSTVLEQFENIHLLRFHEYLPLLHSYDMRRLLENAREPIINTRKVCAHFLKGSCPGGSNCDFSHDPAALPASGPVIDESVICKHFAAGNCKLGAKCHFKHINPLQTDKRFSHSHSSSSSSNTSTTFIPHRVCSYFVEGRCARGKACTFLHPTEKSASAAADPGSFDLPPSVQTELEQMPIKNRTLLVSELRKSLSLASVLRPAPIKQQLTRFFPELDPHKATPELASAVVEEAFTLNKRDRRRIEMAEQHAADQSNEFVSVSKPPERIPQLVSQNSPGGSSNATEISATSAASEASAAPAPSAYVFTFPPLPASPVVNQASIPASSPPVIAAPIAKPAPASSNASGVSTIHESISNRLLSVLRMQLKCHTDVETQYLALLADTSKSLRESFLSLQDLRDSMLVSELTAEAYAHKQALATQLESDQITLNAAVVDVQARIMENRATLNKCKQEVQKIQPTSSEPGN